MERGVKLGMINFNDIDPLVADAVPKPLRLCSSRTISRAQSNLEGSDDGVTV